MIKKAIFVFLILFNLLNLCAQKVEILTELPGKSFRGLSIYKNIVWVSGTQGTIGRSTDGGKSWQWKTISGYETVDFRDIEALDENTAIIMGIASPAYILKTNDGGNTWKKVYENHHPSIFLDAVAFKNKKKGIAIGDPILNKIFVIQTRNSGNTWEESDMLHLIHAQPGEAFFAASGTNVAWNRGKYYIVSGGIISRLFIHRKTILLPITQGAQMKGANGIAIKGKNILIPGGNYNDLHNKDSAFIYSTNGGKKWHYPQTMPRGYKSCVCHARKNVAVACGITGVDMSDDGGKTWKAISDISFNVCAYNKLENAIYFAGNNGKLGKMIL